jgi:peptidoglycan/LPS O-acetylase OafA/YrhL
MRTIAIYYVVIGHGLVFLKGTFIETLFKIIYIDGVEIFFALSGFLIGSILIRMTKHRQISYKYLMHFWIRRWFRTLPLYYLFLALNIILGYFNIINNSIEEFSIKFIFFLQNFNWYFTEFFLVSWSLAVEEWFYLLFPIAFFCFCYFINAKNAFYIAVILFILSSIFFRAYIGNDINNYFHWDLKIRKVVLARLDAIMWGVVAARLLNDYPEQFLRYRFHALLSGLFMYALSKSFQGFPVSHYYVLIYLTVASFSIAMTIPFFYGLKTNNNYLKVFFTFSSTISYSVYLVHAILLGIILKIFEQQTLLTSAIGFFGYLLGSNLISWWSYRFLEKPALEIRDHKIFQKLLN